VWVLTVPKYIDIRLKKKKKKKKKKKQRRLVAPRPGATNKPSKKLIQYQY
jgi:hypothetical protein